MSSHFLGKAVSVGIVSILLGCVMHYDTTRRGQLGREEFLAKQAERYDKHFGKTDPLVLDVVGCGILAVPLFCVYEGLAWVASKAFKGMDDRNDS